MHPVYSEDWVHSIKPQHKVPEKVSFRWCWRKLCAPEEALYFKSAEQHTAAALRCVLPIHSRKYDRLSHCLAPPQFYEKAGYFAVSVMRRSFDLVTGYNEKDVCSHLTHLRRHQAVHPGSSPGHDLSGLWLADEREEVAATHHLSGDSRRSARCACGLHSVNSDDCFCAALLRRAPWR